MAGTWLEALVARRSFLGRLGAGIGVIGAAAVASSPAVAAALPAASPKEWKPARHEQDNWLEEVPGLHRFVFDTTTAGGFDAALRYAQNYYFTNEMSYGLKDSDLAVLFIARARSTAFGYSDAMWAKYGMMFSQQSGFTDPKTKQPPAVNFFARAGDAADQDAGTMQALIKMGVRIGVCAAATRNIALRIATATNGDREAINKELSSNLICPNARMVPAGIVAVNRAQERGYSLVSPG